VSQGEGIRARSSPLPFTRITAIASSLPLPLGTGAELEEAAT